MKGYIKCVCLKYTNNPYHNWTHGYTVMAWSGEMIRNASISSLLDTEETCALMVAGMCHDVGHEGLNSDFYIKVKHDLAIRYNDESVLENMHAYLTFELTRIEANNWMRDFSESTYVSMRKIMVRAILATDMKMHFDLSQKFAELADEFNANDEIDEDDPRLHDLVLRGIVHAADIGNSVLKFDLSLQW